MRLFTAEQFGRKAEFEALSDLQAVKEHFSRLPANLREGMREKNRTYVSLPSKDPRAPSPHATGGAVDVWLHQNGKPVDLGVLFDWMEEDAGAFYHLRFPWNRKRFKDDRNVRDFRSRLLLAMVDAGFSCYPHEIWHFNLGNQMDSLVTGRTAIYSYIEPSA